MDQNKRTKVLAGALAAVMGFGFIRPDQKIMEPVRKAEKAYKSAEEKLEMATEKNTRVIQAEVNLENAQAISLPPSPTDALRVYQKWITNLAEQCNFAALRVSPGRIDNRADRYLAVNVLVEAEVGLEDLSRFMFLFDQAAVKHRITNLDITSTGTSGKPRMEVILTAEGMSVTGTASHDDVFPVTTLTNKLAADETELTVVASDEFPKKTPFLAQVGFEMVEVTATDAETWTVNRGVQGTKASQHDGSEYVQLFPVRYQDDPVKFEDYQNFLASSPFVKPTVPRKLSPRIAGLSDKTIAPGESVAFKVSTVDVNADVGAITYTLEDSVDGMTLDPETGEFKWETTAEVEAKTYSPNIVVLQKNNQELKLAKSFKVTIRLPNDAPTLEVASEAIVVLGQTFELGLSAEDDGDASQLNFSLEGDVPEGLSLDGSSRKLTWMPAKTFSPGEYDVTVKVTDGGEPAKSATESVKLKVQDDQAVYMKLTGSVALDGKPVALLRNLISADNPKLKVGDKLNASEISATVKEIASRYILIEDADGIWQIDLGNTVRDRKLIEAAVKPEEADPTEAATAAEVPDSATDADGKQQAVEADETKESVPTEAKTEAKTEPADSTEAEAVKADAAKSDAVKSDAVKTDSVDTKEGEVKTEEATPADAKPAETVPESSSEQQKAEVSK
ncbi:MAG: putative Ig domain-containing protein [Fuerstiella sp.]